MMPVVLHVSLKSRVATQNPPLVQKQLHKRSAERYRLPFYISTWEEEKG